MKRIIAPIRLQEQSENVKNLHKAMEALGFTVIQDEKTRGIAGENTILTVRTLQRQFNIQFDDRVLVDDATADHLNGVLSERRLLDEEQPDLFKVSGKVFNQFGQPINEKTVMAFDVDLRGAAICNKVDSLRKMQENGGFELLGRNETDNDGSYEISFTADKFLRSEKGLADVIAYLVDGDAILGRSILTSKRDYFENRELQNLHIFATNNVRSIKSEYARLMEALNPLLRQSDLNLFQLAVSEDQIKFLSVESEQPEDRVRLLIKADQLRADPRDSQLSHELLYGVGRQNILLSWFALAVTPEERLLNALKKSIQENIISPADPSTVIQFVNLVHTIANNKSLDDSITDNEITLSSILNLSIPDRTMQNSFVAAYRNFSGTPEKFWKEFLPQQPGFGNEETIRSLQLTNQLTLLTGNHFPLIQELQKERGIRNTRQLLEISVEEWKSIVQKTGLSTDIAGEVSPDKINEYVDYLQGLLNAAYPTEKIVLMIRNGDVNYDDLEVKASLDAFLDTNQDFDFSSSRVENFDQAIRSIANGKHEHVKKELKTLQRVFQISSSPAVMMKLMEHNLHSAYQISSIPYQSFQAMYGNVLGEANASTVYARASYHSAQAQHTAMMLQELTHGLNLGSTVYSPLTPEIKEVINKHIPNYEELFGGMDICECQDCSSVYSASAYLVDVLRFLEKSAKNGINHSPLDILLSRRPDLVHIPLTCENTNTVIPYIDLVNEVLEFYTVNDKLDEHAAHDTGDATTDELHANPQYTMLEAYKKLKDTVYPFNLPYHQPLDNIRRYLEHLRTSRYDLMKTYRVTVLPENERAIFSEGLYLSQEEFQILTGHNFNDVPTNKSLWEYYGYTNDNELKSSIFQVPNLIRQSGILYTDLVELVRTQFINPHQFTLDYLEKLFAGSNITPNVIYSKLSQINAGTLDPVSDNELMLVLTSHGLTATEFAGWVTTNFEKFQEVITLFEPDSQCDLEQTTIRSLKSIYENLPQAGISDDIVSRVHRFIRLWRRTGWSIHELDNAIVAVGENEINPELIRKISLIKTMQATLKPDLRQLACCWGNIETNGKKSLYEKLFLNKAVQKIDDVFKPGKFGDYLTNQAVLIKEHTPAILAAFRLNAESFDAIIEDSKIILDSAVLSLQNLSILYRYVFFAKTLKTTVTDLCLLKKLSGKDPFSSWDAIQQKYVDIDPQRTADFIYTAQQIKSSGFKLQELNYILEGVTTPDSKIPLSEEKIRQTIKTIHENLQRVDLNHPTSDIENVTHELIRAKIQVLFNGTVADQFLAMLDGKIVYASMSEKNLAVVIPVVLTEKVTYVKGSGRLQVIGILSDGDRLTLENLVGATDSFKNAILDIYNQPARFIKDNFSGIFGIAIEDAIKKLIDHPTQIITLSVQEKLKFYYKAYLPFLKRQLKRNIVVQHIATMVALDEVTMQTLLDGKVDDIVNSLTITGLSARYFTDMNFSQLGVQRIDPVIDFKWNAGSPDVAIPADNFSARWEGWICPGQTADYSLIAEVQEADEAVKVWIDDQLTIEKAAGDPLLSWESITNMAAGKLYKLKLEYSENILDAGIRLLWQTANQPREIIPSQICFPDLTVQEFTTKANKIHKAALFINGFKLTTSEVEHFKKYSVNFSNIDFSALQKDHWLRIANYVQLRNELPKTFTTLVQVFDEANKTNPVPTIQVVLQKLVLATGWNATYVDYLVNAHFNLSINDIKNEINLTRLNRAIKLAKKTEADVESLAQWSRAESDFDKLNGIAQDIKNTVKARYEETDWMEVSRKLSDKIREGQKQALISHLLQKQKIRNWGAEDADGLYEYFLIDVQMEAIMDTSRIKQAISSIQLFISRCLLNLESERNNSNQEIGVSPGSIDTTRWEWMKNYRVWEANRKIFLYPENWLEPEWRDDKSPFFRELEADLLQNDITDESVENAFRAYLFKLNEVANMQVSGMYQDQETGTLHVFSRTHTEPYRYYYRTRNQFNHWTNWEKIPVDIKPVKCSREEKDYSGIHLIPLVWKKRLFLFWTEFMEKTQQKGGGSQTADAAAKSKKLDDYRAAKHWEINLAWTEYKNGKWSAKQVSKEALVPGSTMNVKDWSEFIVFQMAPFTDLAKEYRFSAGIDSKNRLGIKLLLNNQEDHGSFRLSDIQAKIATKYSIGSWGQLMADTSSGSVNSLSTLKISGQHSMGNVSAQILDSSASLFQTPSKYYTNFMGFELNDALQLKGNTYFKKKVAHNLLYSHQIKTSSFEGTLNYPFFYFDEERSYFISPEDFTYIIPTLRHPEKLPFYAFEKLKNKNLVAKFPKQPGVDLDDIQHGGISEDILMNIDGLVDAPQSLLNTNLAFNRTMPLAGDFHLGAAKTQMKSNNMKTAVKVQSAFTGNTSLGAKIGMKVVNLKQETGLRVYSFFHPYSSDFITRLNEDGLPGLQSADTDFADDNGNKFKAEYDPNLANGLVRSPLPAINVDFDEFGTYSSYNWELFFHAPLFIATRLCKNGKYAEAMNWFHYIFDPTTNEVPDGANPNARYWKLPPFKKLPQLNLEDYLKNLSTNENPGERLKLINLINEWKDNPFKPHLVARSRPIAYMKNVVVKYVENLIAWGDSLFMTDTMENINQATQLYVMAGHILGQRPQFVPKRGTIQPETFHSLQPKLDEFSNALVQMENLFPYSSDLPAPNGPVNSSLLGIGKALYFSIPNNDKILAYWDTVADRLFKIRHSMNIDGVERKLALFEPPIDPGMLAQAVAKGLSLGSVLADLNSPAPFYRFNFLLQKAREFCGEVKALGAALLSAVEKKEMEELSRKRAVHESALLNLMRNYKEKQILEAKANKQQLEKSREATEKRLKNFLELIAKTDYAVPSVPAQLPADSNKETFLADTIVSDIVSDVDTKPVDIEERGIKIIQKEKNELSQLETAFDYQQAANVSEGTSAILNLIPNISFDGKFLGIGAGFSFGGGNLGSAASAAAKAFAFISSISSFHSNQSSKLASYIRREQEWTSQANFAARELPIIDKQLLAADIRIQLAEKELDNHDEQIKNAAAIEQYLLEKFSTPEMYQWMQDQLFSVYKQAYQMAYDMARKAEKAYRFELGKANTNFIQFGYWDSAYQGLTAGEKLDLALRQMEKNFLEDNKREFELTKHVSVALLNPFALAKLKQTGSCEFSLPEELFDFDYAGHYFRRIKSVSVSIPAITGPYSTINCTLRLLKNSIRMNTANGDTGYEHNHDDGLPIDDERFVENNIPFKSIATSSGQNDHGIFEVNFRDERYLPFEGAGVISSWKFECNGKYVIDGEVVDIAQFDYNSISDVILHVRYSAREDAGKFREDVVKHLDDYMKKTIDSAPEPFVRLFSLKEDFPDAFYQLMNPITGNEQSTAINITKYHFNKMFSGRIINAEETVVLLRPKEGKEITNPTSFTVDNVASGLWLAIFNTEMKKTTVPLGEFDPVKTMTITATGAQPETAGLNKDEIDDIMILLYFRIAT